MRRIGTVDLDILHLGVKNGGAFDEKNIEESPMGSMGVGRILDALASLRDRKMIMQDSGGAFSVTDMAKRILWDEEAPLWARMLRLLQVRSCTIEEASNYLIMPVRQAEQEAESLRKAGQVIMSPQWRDGRLLKIYEIQDDGISRIDRADRDGFAGPGEIINEIEKKVSGADMDKGDVLRLLQELRDSL